MPRTVCWLDNEPLRKLSNLRILNQFKSRVSAAVYVFSNPRYTFSLKEMHASLSSPGNDRLGVICQLKAKPSCYSLKPEPHNSFWKEMELLSKLPRLISLLICVHTLHIYIYFFTDSKLNVKTSKLPAGFSEADIENSLFKWANNWSRTMLLLSSAIEQHTKAAVGRGNWWDQMDNFVRGRKTSEKEQSNFFSPPPCLLLLLSCLCL